MPRSVIRTVVPASTFRVASERVPLSFNYRWDFATQGTLLRASARRGRCILGAPDKAVDLDRHPAARSARVGQFKRGVRAVFREQPRALADDHRVREQDDLVDQVVVEQPADQAGGGTKTSKAWNKSQ